MLKVFVVVSYGQFSPHIHGVRSTLKGAEELRDKALARFDFHRYIVKEFEIDGPYDKWLE